MRVAIVHDYLNQMGGAERVANGILEGAKGLIQGITCGAGMPAISSSRRVIT